MMMKPWQMCDAVLLLLRSRVNAVLTANISAFLPITVRFQ